MREFSGLIINASGLTKSYGRVKVLDSLDLQIGRSEIAIVQGINGSGKTTLQSIFSSLTTADTGKAEICGSDTRFRHQKTRGMVGFVGHSSLLYGSLTVAENLAFFGRLYDSHQDSSYVDGLVSQLGLQDRINQRVSMLSHGLRKRVSIARALINKPKVLLLDEPESGLDMNAARTLEKIVVGFAQQGGAVLITTHNSTLDYGGYVAHYSLTQGKLK